MPLDQEHINRLLQKYKDRIATDAEKEELTEWYRHKAYQAAAFPESEEAVEISMRARLNREIRHSEKPTYRTAWLAAASVLLVMGIAVGVIYWTQEPPATIGIVTDGDISPGGSKATLTLADGSKISLEDIANGPIANQNKVQVSKLAAGQLIYTAAVAGTSSAVVTGFNTIDVPRGGQYDVTLPDGSRVWLNAFSSLRMPLSFADAGERRVELKGEAYFEIAHNPRLPFTVVSGRQTVQVLGTHFNIKAYDDEADIRTSLLEGKVRVTAGTQNIVLAPGQQAQLAENIIVAEVNTEDAIAWKNGYFHFDDERLEDVMRSVARWYDVKVIFEEERLKDETFGAVTTRLASISMLLRVMEQTGNVRFRIEEKTIKISSKEAAS